MTDEEHQEMLAASGSFIRYCNYINKRLIEKMDKEQVSVVMSYYLTPLTADKALELIKEEME